MRKWTKIGISVTAIIVVGVMLFFPFYLAVFQEMEITEVQKGPYKIAYENHIGDYSKIATVLDKVNKKSLTHGITSSKGIGIYYDNPNVTPKDQLRSKGGLIIEKVDYAKIPALKKSLKVIEINKKDYVMTTFPIRNNLSFIIGVLKAYPAIGKYLEKNNYTAGVGIEIYDMANNQIIYLMEIQK